MPTEFDQSDELHLVGFYLGTVVANEDPEQLGRVRVKVPGLVEPASAWAFPFGTLAGGSAGRGWFSVPEVNADVCVLFYQGDVDRPFYIAGHWGIAAGARETPLQLDGLDKATRLGVTGYETARFQMVFDERAGNEKFAVLDKVNGTLVELSDADGITIRCSDSRGVNIEAGGDVSVNAGGDANVNADGDANVNADGDANVNGTRVNLNGQAPGVARLGDAVVVTIPPGGVIVTNPTGVPPFIPNPVPIPVPGVITSASLKVNAG